MKENDLPDMLQQQKKKFTECQHVVNKDVADMSQEDLKFIEILKNKAELVGRHYQVPLPFRKDEGKSTRQSFTSREVTCLLEEKNCQEILNLNKIA